MQMVAMFREADGESRARARFPPEMAVDLPSNDPGVPVRTAKSMPGISTDRHQEPTARQRQALSVSFVSREPVAMFSETVQNELAKREIAITINRA